MSDLSHCNIFILILRSRPVLLTYLFHIEIVHVGSYRVLWTKFSLLSSRELTEYIKYTYKNLPYSGVQCMRGRLNIRLSSLCRRCKQMNISQSWVKYTVYNKSTDNFSFDKYLTCIIDLHNEAKALPVHRALNIQVLKIRATPRVARAAWKNLRFCHETRM